MGCKIAFFQNAHWWPFIAGCNQSHTSGESGKTIYSLSACRVFLSNNYFLGLSIQTAGVLAIVTLKTHTHTNKQSSFVATLGSLSYQFQNVPRDRVTRFPNTIHACLFGCGKMFFDTPSRQDTHKDLVLFVCLFFKICSLFNKIHSFEMTMHYALRDALHTMLYNIMSCHTWSICKGMAMRRVHFGIFGKSSFLGMVSSHGVPLYIGCRGLNATPSFGTTYFFICKPLTSECNGVIE